ncbi:hypothetical protein BGX26_007560 [Mortierella sp. AD094]|nr:hypothetical protein BGX26_007560 [Mortierella sp. AD094]
MRFTLSTVALLVFLGLSMSKADSAVIPEALANSPANLEERTCLEICEVTCVDANGQTITLRSLPCKNCPVCPPGYTNVN